MQDVAVMRIAGKTVVDEFHLLVRGVLERVGTSVGFDEAIEGIIIVMVHIHLAEETQFLRWLGESENGDGIPVDVAQPAHVGLGLDLKEQTLDMNIVSLAGPQQRTVGTECDGRAVVILSFMGDADALHEAVESRIWCVNLFLIDSRSV